MKIKYVYIHWSMVRVNHEFDSQEAADKHIEKNSSEGIWEKVEES